MFKKLIFLFIVFILIISCKKATTRPTKSELGTPPSEDGIPEIPDITPPDSEEDYYIKASDSETVIKSKIQKYYEKHNIYVALINDTEKNIEANNTIEKINTIINEDIYYEGVFVDLSKTDMTKIADDSFSENKNLSSIKLPETVTSIGVSAFSNAPNLTAINFPTVLTEIGEGAFYGCVSLQEVNLEYTQVKIISNQSFDGCSKLAKVTLPSMLSAINEKAFNNCESLTAINFPSTLTEILRGAFINCANLQEANLKDTKITILYEQVFNGCSKLEKLLLPNNLSEIKNSAFTYCYSLKEIDFPESLTIIGPFSFAECGFETLIFKEGLLTIDNMAFYKCESLKQVSLSSTLTKIGFYTFTGCTALYDIEYNGENATSLSEDNIFKSDGNALESTPQNLYLPNVDDPSLSDPPSQDPNPWINFLGYDWTDKIKYKEFMPSN